MLTKTLSCGLAAGLTLAASSLSAGSIDLTFTNMSGFLATPVYSGSHNGDFDAFDEGASASAGVELVAELPIPPFAGELGNALRDERLAAAPGSQGGFIFGPGGPIANGESGTATFDIADPVTNRWATFMAMFVPSNDTFIGNDNPFAYEIFDMSGNVIEQTIKITAASIWDAGTEVNQLFGAAAPDQDITLGTDENGFVTQLIKTDGFAELGSLFGVEGADEIRASTVLFTIDVAATPAPIPLPAGAPLLLGGLGLLAWMRRRS